MLRYLPLSLILSIALVMLGQVPFADSSSAQMRSPSGDRYAYVHKRSYRRTIRNTIRSCTCYSVSFSSRVQSWWQVSRHYSWNRAVAARNRYSQARNTCPGTCSRPMFVRRQQPRGGNARRGNTRACQARHGRSYYWSPSRRRCVRYQTRSRATGSSAACRAKYGRNHYWSFAQRRCVRFRTRTGRNTNRGSGGGGKKDCLIYGVVKCN